MRTRFVLVVVALVLSVAAAFSPSIPMVLGQEATPVAVAPPQDLLPTTADYGTGETAEINGIDIYYEVYGEGKPVLLLHGGLANGDHWVNVIPALTDAGYQAIVMDSRGHGRSSFDETAISYEVMASDVLGLMDHLEIDTADIVGWSDGGIIGLEIALTQPERLNKVVAYGANFDPTGVRLDIGQNAYFNAYIEAAAAEYQENSPAPERWDEFLGNISNMWATQPNYTMDQLRSITTSFLILDGEEEEAIDLNQTKLMAELIPDAELILIAGTGHFAMFEQPEEFSRIVLDYLAS
ncbi:MAG: alpha/beta hydrolase [Thermomicrobiales bacterium]|jgi:pimeloyl-ACP methyl ester carboxylesterase|nr:alpha/beta hydrolase [Thermomicrobiales bacterium]